MKNWEARLVELEGRLREWRTAYAAEFARLKKARGKGLFKRLSAAQAEEIGLEAQRAAGEEVLGEVPAFFDELCAHYAEALPGERAKIRARCGQNDEVFSFLWRYVDEAPAAIRSQDDAERLRLALLALAIDDHRVETGQMLDALGRLYTAAVRAGIDPEPLLREVAQVANASTSGGAGHMESYLAGFTDSRYFREHVRPDLAG